MLSTHELLQLQDDSLLNVRTQKNSFRLSHLLLKVFYFTWTLKRQKYDTFSWAEYEYRSLFLFKMQNVVKCWGFFLT